MFFIQNKQSKEICTIKANVNNFPVKKQYIISKKQYL